MALAALNGRLTAPPLGHLDEVALVVHNSDVQIVSWVTPAQFIGYPVVLEGGLKWSVPAFRSKMGLGNRSYFGAEIIRSACGVAHRRIGSYGRPKLPAESALLHRMCSVALHNVDNVDPACSFCKTIAPFNECTFCTIRYCAACTSLSETFVGFDNKLQHPGNGVVPACLRDPRSFSCAQCAELFLHDEEDVVG